MKKSKLEVYNRVVMAIVGTGIMLTFVLGFLASIFSFLPFKQNNSLVVEENKGQEEQEKLLVYYDPIVSEFSDYFMVPVGFQNVSKSKLSKRDSYSSYRSGSSYGESGYYSFYGHFNNLVFKNKETGNTHLLLDKKALITSLYYPYQHCGLEDDDLANFLMFTIVEEDSNDDNLINDKDADSIYLSDKHGKQLVKVNSANTKLIDWTLSNKDKKLFLRLRLDSNGNKKFEESDKMEIIVLDPENPSLKPVPLIDDGTKNQMKKILSK